MGNKDEQRVKVNLSMPGEIHDQLKALASREGMTVSGLVVRWVHEKNGRRLEDMPLDLSRDTRSRLEQYAYENHTTASQAVTDWIWRSKVKNENLRGQIQFDI